MVQLSWDIHHQSIIIIICNLASRLTSHTHPSPSQLKCTTPHHTTPHHTTELNAWYYIWYSTSSWDFPAVISSVPKHHLYTEYFHIILHVDSSVVSRYYILKYHHVGNTFLTLYSCWQGRVQVIFHWLNLDKENTILTCQDNIRFFSNKKRCEKKARSLEKNNMIYSVKFFTKVIESFLSTKYIKVTLPFLKSNSLSIVWELSSFKSCNCSVLNLVEFARPEQIYILSWNFIQS